MIAVSNTTPLRYLIAIDQDHLLAQLFEEVIVPSAVHQELTEARTPEKVRARILSCPSWYQVQSIPETEKIEFPTLLHRGEREAILLAETLRPDVILIDEQIGRAIALSRNLPVSGTLGILERADKIGNVNNFPAILANLRESGFYISGSLEQQLLRRHHARQRSKK
jgi:predicted nucleic acid-binding protein